MTEIRTDCITSDTITFTKYRLLQLAQMAYFPDEYRAFESNVPISKKKPIINTKPISRRTWTFESKWQTI